MKYKNYSILLSLYKKENPLFLSECMESIFNQSVLSNDVVIVFDGPLTPALEDIVNHYLSCYSEILHIIKLKNNQGLGKALNAGLKICKNELIARMDTDDIADPLRFEKQMKFMNENINISIVGSNISEFNKCPTDIVSYRNVPEKHNDIIKFAHKRNPFNHMTVMFKKEDVENVGSYLDMPLAEDYFLWIRLLQKGYLGANLQENLVNARIGNNMIQKRGGISYAKKIFHLRREMYKIHFINLFEFIFYSFCHCTTAVLPISLRREIYIRFIRKKDLER